MEDLGSLRIYNAFNVAWYIFPACGVLTGKSTVIVKAFNPAQVRNS